MYTKIVSSMAHTSEPNLLRISFLQILHRTKNIYNVINILR